MLDKGPVFLSSSINSYYQTTANCSMWNSTLQSWPSTVHHKVSVFCAHTFHLAECLNILNMTVFSMLQPCVSVSVIHSYIHSSWSLSLADLQPLPMSALHTVKSRAFLTLTSSCLSCYYIFPSLLTFHKCVSQGSSNARRDQTSMPSFSPTYDMLFFLHSILRQHQIKTLSSSFYLVFQTLRPSAHTPCIICHLITHIVEIFHILQLYLMYGNL